MKRIILKTILFISIVIVLFLVISYGISFLPVRRSQTSHEVNVRLSQERLANSSSPKIIIIGGSGCGFGFQSELLHEHFKMPVINTGTHAALGLLMQMKLCEKYINQGDIVLIIPEYDQWTERMFYGIAGDSQYRILHNHYPKALGMLNVKQKWYTLLYMPKYGMSALKYHSPIADKTDPYSSASINQYGDVTNWNSRMQSKKTINIGQEITEPIYTPSMDSVSNFIKQYTQVGAYLFLFPPAYISSSYHANELFIKQVSNELERRGVPFVTKTDRYCYEDSLFYDTAYHLTTSGAKIRTNYVIHDLDSCLILEK